MGIPATLSQVPDVTPYIQYIATLGQTAFDYPFPITQDSDLVVVINGVTLATDAGYTVSGVGNNTGGTVTLTSGSQSGDIVTLYRNIPIERLTQFGQNSGFSSTAFNAEFNNVYLLLQQLLVAVGLCLSVPNSNSPAPVTVLTPGAYANKYLAFDSHGNPTPAALTSSGTLTQQIIAGLLYPQSTAESSAGVTPVNLFQPYGSALRYAANTVPGTTDMATGIGNALAQAGQTGGAAPVVPPGTYAIGSRLTVPSGVTFFIQGAIIGLASFSGSNMINLGTTSQGVPTRIFFQGGSLDGNYSGTTCLSDGIDVIAGRAYIDSPTIQHFPNYGIRMASSQSGDSSVDGNIQIQQWNNSDTPAQTLANYTADGIYIDRPDCGVSGSTHAFIRWCKYNVRFGASAATAFIRNFHVYQGNSTGVGSAFVDPVCVRVEAGASSIFMGGMYFDSGHIDVYNADVSIADDCDYLQNSSACLFSTSIDGGVNPAFIRLFYDGSTNPYQFQLRGAKNQYMASSNTPSNSHATILVGVYANAGSYSGDYLGLPTVLPHLGFNDVDWSSGKVWIQGRWDQSLPYFFGYKPGGAIDWNYAVGATQAATPVVMTYGGTTEIHATGNYMQLSARTGSSCKYTLGAGSSAIMDDGSNNLFLQTVNTNRVKVASDGTYVEPAADNATTCGGASFRWSVVYAATGAINTSDAREKNVTGDVLGLDWVMQLKPHAYQWKVGSNKVVRQVYRDPWGNDVPKDWQGVMDVTGQPYLGKVTSVRAKCTNADAVKARKVAPIYVDPSGNVVAARWVREYDANGQTVIRVRAQEAEVETASVPGTRTHFGLLAQEVKATLPEGLDWAGWTLDDKSNPDSRQGLRMDQFIAPLIKAVQEQQAQIAALRAQVAALTPK